MKTKLVRKKILVTLKAHELALLRRIIKSGSRNAREMTRARILLLSHENKTNVEIVDALGCSPRSVTDVRKRYMQRKQSVAAAIMDAPRSGQPKKIMPHHEAFVVATACTDAPSGHAHWTLNALRAKLVDTYTDIQNVSHERIRQILMSAELKPWREKNVVRANAHPALS